MVNSFGRGCPGSGGHKPPPETKKDSTFNNHSNIANELFHSPNGHLGDEIFKKNTAFHQANVVRKSTTTISKNQCSQSGKTFVEVTNYLSQETKMTQAKLAPHIVTPDKAPNTSPMMNWIL